MSDITPALLPQEVIDGAGGSTADAETLLAGDFVNRLMAGESVADIIGVEEDAEAPLNDDMHMQDRDNAQVEAEPDAPEGAAPEVQAQAQAQAQEPAEEAAPIETLVQAAQALEVEPEALLSLSVEVGDLQVPVQELVQTHQEHQAQVQEFQQQAQQLMQEREQHSQAVDEHHAVMAQQQQERIQRLDAVAKDPNFLALEQKDPVQFAIRSLKLQQERGRLQEQSARARHEYNDYKQKFRAQQLNAIEQQVLANGLTKGDVDQSLEVLGSLGFDDALIFHTASVPLLHMAHAFNQLQAQVAGWQALSQRQQAAKQKMQAEVPRAPAKSRKLGDNVIGQERFEALAKRFSTTRGRSAGGELVTALMGGKA